jgi:hypothetical protein
MHAPRQPAIRVTRREGSRLQIAVGSHVTPVEWAEAYEQLLLAEPQGDVLWDLTEGALRQLTGAEVQGLAYGLARIRARHQGRPCALLCPRDIDYGMGRMLSSYAECADPPADMVVFRDPTSAWRWLEMPRGVAG